MTSFQILGLAYRKAKLDTQCSSRASLERQRHTKCPNLEGQAS